ncbi:MAG: sodium:proton antiporter, partial [Planctomycetaceae bacterium]
MNFRGRVRNLVRIGLVGLLALLWHSSPLLAADVAGAGEPLGLRLPLWSVLPFIALLGCIATLPLFAGHWWEHNRNKGAIVLGLGLPLVLLL